MKSYEKLLLSNNRKWATETVRADPEFFNRLAEIQRPEFLWIGCSDSRVPAERITLTQPGEIFVHRNIANVVVATDLNMLSVLQYAVEALKIKHIILCGHYGCGGVRAAMDHQYLGLINQWLCHIKDVYRDHHKELEEIRDLDKRADRLVELNVIAQAYNLVKTSVVQNAWRIGEFPIIHGWVYSLRDGLLHELISIDRASQYDLIYKLKF
ncbi:MAG TPA: carbonate dehydratase [Gammaproteobacteria bacterium]|nr:carbonate dehydratase [Gammaproteobacteria bacterium]